MEHAPLLITKKGRKCFENKFSRIEILIENNEEEEKSLNVENF